MDRVSCFGTERFTDCDRHSGHETGWQINGLGSESSLVDCRRPYSGFPRDHSVVGNRDTVTPKKQAVIERNIYLSPLACPVVAWVGRAGRLACVGMEIHT